MIVYFLKLWLITCRTELSHKVEFGGKKIQAKLQMSIKIKLACVAGARKGKGGGNWAREKRAARARPISPFPFLVPATQAKIKSEYNYKTFIEIRT